MSKIDESQSKAWAEAVFGRAKLGDARRTRRVVSMTSAAILRPGGTLTAVFDNPAELAGAYDLVENEAVDPEELARCLARHTADLARLHFYVWIATDGTSQHVTDRKKLKGTGPIGTTRARARGDKIHDALVLDPGECQDRCRLTRSVGAALQDGAVARGCSA